MTREKGIVPSPDEGERLSKSEKAKTKIDAVREQLQTNPDVYFAGEVHHYHPDAPESGYWTETVDIVVSPKVPEFDGEKLNLFMDGLIIGIKTSARDAARSSPGGHIDLGKLYFDETIGSVHKTTITVLQTTEPDVMKKAERNIGETRKEWSAEIQRRTWVRVYPDPLSANSLYEYEKAIANGDVEADPSLGYAQHWLDENQVRKLKEHYIKNPLSRLTNLLRKGK